MHISDFFREGGGGGLRFEQLKVDELGLRREGMESRRTKEKEEIEEV